MLIACIAFLAACGGGDADEAAPGEGSSTTEAQDSGDSEGEGAKSGGVLTVLVHQDGTSNLDPARSLVHSTVSSGPLSAIYDLLVYIDPDTSSVEPYLAESVEANDDGTVWTLTLREGVQFSDGTPFDAEAVKAEVERLADPEVGAAARSAAEAVTVNAVDEVTVEFMPDEPDLNYDGIIALNFSMIPSPTAIAADPEGFEQNPVGAGPFILTDWVVGERKTFERNPNYWQEGKPYLDGFETIVVTDPQQQINRMDAGDADLISNQTAELFQSGRDAGFEVVTGGPLSGGFIWIFNHDEAPFDDVRARRAFQLIVDNEAMNELLFPAGGVATPVNHLSETSPYFDPELNLAEPDAEEAQALLDELAAAGKPLSFELTTRVGPATQGYAEFAQSAFAKFDNADVNIRVLEGGDYLSAVRGGEYSAAYYTGWWSAPYPVMHQIYQTDGPLNYSHFSNPEVDALFDEARATSDQDELREIYGEIVSIMNDEVAVIPFQVAEVGFIKTDALEGVKGVHLGNTPLWAEMNFVE
ncbi:MAG: ABC transporter substrate-binding protein [Acidimicrobiales bacterium]